MLPKNYNLLKVCVLSWCVSCLFRRTYSLFSLQNKVINYGLVSKVARIRLFTKAKCLFHRDKFLPDGKILSVISLLPGGCLFTVKYSTVLCGGERDSVTAYGGLSYSKIFAFFLYWAFLYRVSAYRKYFLLPTDIRLDHGTLFG